MMTLQNASTYSPHEPTQAKPDWRNVIVQWQQSGLSVSAFCQQQNLPEHQIYYYRRKFLLSDSTPKPKTQHSGFAQITVSPCTQGNVQLRLPSGIELTGLSLQYPKQIAELIKALS